MPTQEIKLATPEKSPVATLNAIQRLKDALQECGDLESADLTNVPDDMLREAAASATINLHNLQMARIRRAAKEAREKETPQGFTKPVPAEPEQWIEDSWIFECEAAGVYSMDTPMFRYAEEPAAAVMLTQSELQMIAQRHLNTVLWHLEYTVWTGDKGERYRKYQHESRFWQLFEQLTPDGQERFQRQIDIRMQYINSVKAEGNRRHRGEGTFLDAVKEGIVPEADIAEYFMGPHVGGKYNHEKWGIFGIEDEESNREMIIKIREAQARCKWKKARDTSDW
jgi:hypothetical protein